MRPFLIPTTKQWVDLDTVQWIEEPFWDDRMGRGGFFVTLRWQHAFREEADSRMFEVLWKSSQSYLLERFGKDPDPERCAPGGWKDAPGHEFAPGRFMVPYEGEEPEAVAKIRREVFAPFWKAWTGREHG